MVHVSDETVSEVRYVVQFILVPIVFIVGLLGNSVSIYVLTRISLLFIVLTFLSISMAINVSWFEYLLSNIITLRLPLEWKNNLDQKWKKMKRMRCTTNIYLTALAVSDIFYLALVSILSLQHYPYVRMYVPFYWYMFGTFVWLCDAFAYISTYITVCFTIERFIAIRYPLKRQTFCTESLAKKVIAGVVIFCMLSTLSTIFEHKPKFDYRLLDENAKICVQNFTGNSVAPSEVKHMEVNHLDLPTSIEGSGSDFTMDNAEEGLNRLKRSLQPEQQVEATSASMNIPPSTITPTYFADPGLHTNDMGSGVEPNVPPAIYWENQNKQEMPALDLTVDTFNGVECKNLTYYSDSPGIFDELYESIWSYVSLIVYVLMPLTVLVTFNCFLVLMVRRSNTLRGKMTNASSMRRPKVKSSSGSVSQENRVTITLIAVVVCFISFQLPWATFLVVSLRFPDLEKNVRLMCGNIFNFLVMLNAAANFFLYCLLSDKYRKTVRELVSGKSRRYERGNLTTTSIMTNNTSRWSYRPAPTSPPGIKREASRSQKGL